ncbi:MAG: TolC family protein [Bacteroidetes bacterium]|uniref:TolC family protein n=1 Tax=Candidatus Cryptobacteroides intestinavium TaxID=2840766 RepID=A0A9D9HIG5_9BACT|nr:TolC family protein [Candidatus Cryptobacteroides intestinavium]
MNRTLNIFCRLAVVAALASMMSGCGIYGKFKAPEYEETADAYGDIAAGDSTSMGDILWRDFFDDKNLQALIDTALANNSDMVTAKLRIDEANASLKAARLAYVPGLDVSPNAAYGYDIDAKGGSWSFQLPVNASWQVDIFGKLTNAKRRQLAAYMQSNEYARAVQAQLVATVAIQYYSLLALDAQYEIYKETEKNWRENVRVTEQLLEAGRYTADAVYQAQSNYYSVCNNLLDIRQQLHQTENQMCSLLGKVSGTPIERGSIEDWTSPEMIDVGIPVEVLSNRPDVKQAEYQFAQAFYTTNGARSAMYPSITITGSLDFYSMIVNAVGSLVEPIFQQGQLRANLKIAKAQQAEAEVAFRQSIIDAGIEVNNTMIALRTAQDKTANYAAQVSSLEKAVKAAQSKMQDKNSTYLEVLTAQQSLLTAQVAQISNRLSEISEVITLYQALGGGCE